RNSQIPPHKVASEPAMHLLACGFRERVAVGKFNRDLRAAIVQHHLPWFFAVLTPEIANWHRREGDQPELGYQLPGNQPPVGFLRDAQRALPRIVWRCVSLTRGRVAPKLGAAARANGNLPPKLRRQSHHDTVIDILGTLAG